MLFPAMMLAALAVAPGPTPPAPATPVPATSVEITDTFWSARQKANREGTLAANFEQCDKTGRLSNFDKAARREGKYEGYFFNDSDVYKSIEGACYILARTKDPALDAQLDAVIARIAAAQRPDGYLNAYYTLAEPGKEWTDLAQKHEMYCAGHLIEAAVAHHRATGKRSLLDVATRFADLIDSRYGPPPKHNGICGHEEIELALFKLWKETGETRYRDLASYFLSQRGHSAQVGAKDGSGEERPLFGEYCQDHAPLESQEHIVGHAVRAMYFYSAATDFSALTADPRYVPALERVWTDLTTTKMYITGGIGNSSSNEGFTTGYDLPNDSAYAETCAGIGLVLWGHRMAMLHGVNGAPYMDVVERGLYNGVLSGVSNDGRRFFYVNPLGSTGDHHRQDWFGCACCPPNILRLVELVGGMAYATADDSLFVNLFIASTAKVEIPHAGAPATPVTLTQRTNYPWEGDVRVALTLPAPCTFEIRLRVPAWCRSIESRVNDSPSEGVQKDGYLSIRREWHTGDVVFMRMAMPVERMYSHPAVQGNVGRAAFQRGPIVYCFEHADNPKVPVRQAAIPAGAEIRAEHLPGLLGGVTVLRTKAQIGSGALDGPLYAPADARTVTLTAIPYFAWDNREPGEMLVWMPETLALAERPLDPTITATSSYSFPHNSLGALYDRRDPTSSIDHDVPRTTFWPHKACEEWVQYDFKEPRTIKGVEVYWFDDIARGGGCALPVSWTVQYRDAETWKDLPTRDTPGVAADTFNRVAATEPVTTSALRLRVRLRDDASAGILEWRVLR